MMERCRACEACRRHCPAGAITAERFLLRAERCITFHNEKPANVPFPAWFDPAWQDCLLGCLRCQWVCPENRDVGQWVEDGVAFTQAETALLLRGVPLEEIPGSTLEKMQRVHLDRYAATLPRNLGALLADVRQSTRSQSCPKARS
jgi:epoxyqueuosine reductase